MTDPTPAAVVDAFLAAICAKDLDLALTMVTDDVVYDNQPLMAVTGPDGIRAVLAGFLDGASEIEWVVHRQVADGAVVMNERSDRFLIDGEWKVLPVMGVFEVHDGKVTLWRDYFDVVGFQKTFGPLG